MKTRRQKAQSKKRGGEQQELYELAPTRRTRAEKNEDEAKPKRGRPASRSRSSSESENKKNKDNRRPEVDDQPNKKRRLDEAAVSKPSPKQSKKAGKKKGKSRPKSSSSEKQPSVKKDRKSLAKKQDRDESQQKMKKIIVKGKIPVDQHFSGPASVHVLEHGGKIYSQTLNQTSMQANSNKYYILQILEMDNGKGCYFWTRWGRVGVKGQTAISGPINRELAIRQYEKKFYDKHIKGEYRQLSLNYADDKEQEQKKSDEPVVPSQKQKAKNFQTSQLSKPVKELIDLIFDLNMMNRQMIEIGYDAKKMPLGKLSDENIKYGYSTLKKLMQAIKDKDDRLVNSLNDQFFSMIPHDFGFQKMKYFMIDTEDKVKKKLDMLESLADIKVATRLLGDGKSDANRYDENYAKLNRDITQVRPTSKEFEVIEQYLINTHGETHRAYHLELRHAYRLNSDSEGKRFTREIPNKMLLWHGSRLTNFVGILSQGLRIAPPEAPVTGYMFGKGVYFADMVSKSANYCCTSPMNPQGLLLLCEVALGETHDLFNADYNASNLPHGKHSTKGVGRNYPPRTSYVDLDGVQVPIGKPIKDSSAQNYALQYNEYIVYDVKQVRLKYLLWVKFVYNTR